MVEPGRAALARRGGAVLPQGGRVALPGGRRVFDLFLTLGYHAFHLTRAEGVRLGAGVRLFSACKEGQGAESVLARHGAGAGQVTC